MLGQRMAAQGDAAGAGAGAARDGPEAESASGAAAASAPAAASADAACDSAKAAGAAGGGCAAAWGEARDALWLVLLCVLSGACFAIPVALVTFALDDWLAGTFGAGNEKQFCFRNTTGMLHREVYVVAFDLSSVASRSQRWARSVFAQVFMVVFMPLNYAVYLGSSRAFAILLGTAAIFIASVAFASVYLNIGLFFDYSVGMSLLGTFLALKLLCPRDSKIPLQSLKQGLVIVVVNLLVNSKINERSVRRVPSAALARPFVTDPPSRRTGSGPVPVSVRAA
jgi:hypothetical protein